MESYRNLLDYMEESCWFESDVYVVWTHGCTDGWPQAIFNGREGAEVWVANIRLNPEGYDIIPMNFRTLCQTVSGVR
jgi:hypothetical protein